MLSVERSAFAKRLRRSRCLHRVVTVSRLVFREFFSPAARMKFRLAAFAVFLGVFGGSVLPVSAAAPERHVIVVVFDGMRPDFITAETTPNLWRLANEGVFFAHHHPVYLSATEVNGTAIATGAYPSRSSMIANVDFRPAIDLVKAVATENPDVVRKGDEVSGGKYLAVPTVAEILH